MSDTKMRPLDAYTHVMAFARQRGEFALRLALHAAVPQVIRPELLHLLRLNFVPEALDDLALEADVLFASFCEELGNGYFRLDPGARSNLLAHLDPTYADAKRLRSRKVAGFLVQYLAQQMQAAISASNPLYSAYLELEYWSAFAFLDPDAAAEQLAAAVQAASVDGQVTARLRIAGLASTLTTPLVRHQRLLTYAAAVEALQEGAIDRANELVQSLDDSELKVGNVTLRSPRSLLRAKPARAVPAEATATRVPETESERQAGESEVSAEPVEVFVSYQRQDRRWLDRLQIVFKPYARSMGLRLWSDLSIRPGEDENAETQKAIERSRVGIVLVSAHYLASDYGYSELNRLVERARASRMRLCWIPISTCHWQVTPLSEFQAAIDPTTPLAHFREPERNRKLVEVVQLIVEFVRATDPAPKRDQVKPLDTESPSKEGAYLLFVGHTIDTPDRELSRFPATLEPAVRAAIRRAVLEELKHFSGVAIGIASGSTGGDILFHEVCAELGIETRLHLPYEKGSFVERFIAPMGTHWVERFERVFAGAKEAVSLTSRPSNNAEAWRRTSEAILSSGLERGVDNAVLIALWDGSLTESPGVPTGLLGSAKMLGVRVVVLDPRSLQAEMSTAAGDRNTTNPATDLPQDPLFFISYSHADRAPAERLYQALRALGAREKDIWFDRGSIERGMDFFESSLAGIRTCRHFLPLVSRATVQHTESFARYEWNAATDRAKGMLEGDFIFPIVVDSEFEPETYTASSPAREWLSLRLGHAPGGLPVPLLEKQLKQLIRGARQPLQ